MMSHRRFSTVTLCFLAYTATARAEEQRDIDKLQGTWLAVSSERGEEQLPKEELSSLKLVIDGEKYTVLENNKGVQEKIALDSTTNPKSIDFAFLSFKASGIYALEGDMLKICRIALFGKGDRPKEFATKKGTDTVLQVWKRKPD